MYWKENLWLCQEPAAGVPAAGAASSASAALEINAAAARLSNPARTSRADTVL